MGENMAETATKADIYKPTAKERKLIEVMSEPMNRNLNVTELCQSAEISRDSYYTMMRKTEFLAYFKQAQFEVVKGSIAKVLSATIDFAINEPKCHQDRKIILEMGEMYKEKIQQEMTGADGVPLKVIFDSSMG